MLTLYSHVLIDPHISTDSTISVFCFWPVEQLKAKGLGQGHVATGILGAAVYIQMRHAQKKNKKWTDAKAEVNA